MKKRLLLVLSSFILNISAFCQTSGPYLPSPDLSKLNGTWAGSYKGFNFKLILKSKKQYIKSADYSTDLLEGNFGCGKATLQSIDVDTNVKAITNGHFYDPQTKGLIVLNFTDVKKNNKMGKILLSPIQGDSKAYKMTIVNRASISKVKEIDTAFSVPRYLLLKKID